VAAIDTIFFQAARLGRRNVGDPFTAARFQRRDFGPELKYLHFEAVISQLGANQLSSCSTRHRCPAAVESEQDGQ